MDRLAIQGGDPVSDSMIPIVKPVFSESSKKDVCKVLDSGYVRMGPYTKKFEAAFSKRVGAEYAYAVCNGTAALHTAFMSILEPNDEVIVPAFTFFATASAVLLSRGRPIFVDIEPDTFLIDVEEVKEKITEKTRAVAPVHLFGNAADLKALTEIAEDEDLMLVHDSAQAHGTEYKGKDIGGWKNINCYSFYPTKTLTTGEGGIATTNDEELYNMGCLLRSHGESSRYTHVALGLNYRMTDIAAAIGLNQLSKLDDFLEARRHVGNKMRKMLQNLDAISPQKINPEVNPSYSYFSVKLDLEKLECSREQFMEALKAENIASSVHYPIPLTKQKVIKEMLNPESCPISEETSRCIMSLPMHPYLTDGDIDLIVNAIDKVINHYHV